MVNALRRSCLFSKRLPDHACEAIAILLPGALRRFADRGLGHGRKKVAMGCQQFQFFYYCSNVADGHDEAILAVSEKIRGSRVRSRDYRNTLRQRFQKNQGATFK